MGTADRQDDSLLTIPGLSMAEKMEICAAVSKGQGVATALSAIGRYMDDLDVAKREDVYFAKDYEMACRLRDEAIEAALHRKAVRGNVPAIKFWLVNRRSQEWQETRTIRHTGADGGAIEVEHTTAAIRELLTSKETRDDALAWIGRGDADAIDAHSIPALSAGDGASGEDPQPGQSG